MTSGRAYLRKEDGRVVPAEIVRDPYSRYKS